MIRGRGGAWRASAARGRSIALAVLTAGLLMGGGYGCTRADQSGTNTDANPGLEEARRLDGVALKHYHAGEYAEGIQPARQALEIRERLLGPEHPDVATSLNNLAQLYRSQGRYAEAEPLHQRALTIREKALGPEHPDRKSTRLNSSHSRASRMPSSA